MTDDDADDVRGPASRSADLPDAAAAAPATRAPEAATAGGMIRAAREAQGIDLGSLAAMLKIPMKKLEALEADRHDELPGASFERALAQAACRVLQIDPRPVLALLPANTTSLERVAGSLNEPFRERQPSRGDLGDAASLLRPAVLLPVVLVLAAAALLFVPPALWHRISRQVGLSIESEEASAPAQATLPPFTAASTPGVSVTPVDLGAGAASSAAAPVAVPASASLASEGPAASAAILAPVPAAASAAGANAAQVAQAAQAAHVPAPGASAAAPAAVSPVAPTAAANVHAAVVVTARQATWVEAIDAQGRTLVSRTVPAGESVGLDGAMPMKLKIGNAQGATVTLRGQAVDLSPWVRDNVARLQLK